MSSLCEKLCRVRRVFLPDAADRESAVRTPWVLRATYLYLALPFVIFALGWMRLFIGIPVALLLCFCLYLSCREAPAVPALPVRRRTVPYFCLLLFVVLLVVFFSGVGGFSYQNDDHYWRNSIFEALVRYRFPVRETWGDGTQVGLIYYIGYWLPAALFGKLFGVGAGYVFLFLWTVLGVFLFSELLMAVFRRHAVSLLIFFFAFSGLDLVVHLVNGNFAALWGVGHLEWGEATFQYSSFITQLYWTFNQALPAWLFTLALFLQKNNRNMIFLLGLMPLCSAFPFVGLLPFAVYLMVSRHYKDENGKALHGKARVSAFFRDTLTLPNLLGGGVSGLLSALYLFGNARLGGGQSDGGRGLHLVFSEYDSALSFLASYLLFVIFEFLLYFILIWPYRHREPMFYLTLAVLLLTPLPAIGLGYDFCMRVSIPGLLVLFLMVADTLPQMWRDCRSSEKETRVSARILTGLLCLCLLIGARTPFNEFARSVDQTIRVGNTKRRSFPLMLTQGEENFVQPTQNSFFYRYIAAPGRGEGKP